MKKLSELTKDEKSLLLYLETRAVDYGGKVSILHMNKEDQATALIWNKEQFIEYGRIAFEDIKKEGETNWVVLSDEAWNLAHEERKARNKRMWENRNWKTAEEKST